MVAQRMVDPCGQRATHAQRQRKAQSLASSQGRATEQARDDDGVAETQRQADEMQGEKWEKGKRETLFGLCDHVAHCVLWVVLFVPQLQHLCAGAAHQSLPSSFQSLALR